MKFALAPTIVFLMSIAVSKTEAATLYTTTDLGPGYTLETAASGQVYGVANSDGSVVYTFDKSPVTPIDIKINGGSHEGSFTQYTMQIGQFKVGYDFDFGGGLPGPLDSPTFVPSTAGWSVGGPGASPVSDINSQGQVVGMSINFQSGGTFAAFSAVGLQDHDWNAASSVVDNLNNYIATIPGVTLTSAFQIDDLGRILANGSNGDVYLLTPTALGSPSLVPEPSSVLIFGVVGTLFGLRSIRRRRVG